MRVELKRRLWAAAKASPAAAFGHTPACGACSSRLADQARLRQRCSALHWPCPLERGHSRDMYHQMNPCDIHTHTHTHTDAQHSTPDTQARLHAERCARRASHCPVCQKSWAGHEPSASVPGGIGSAFQAGKPKPTRPRTAQPDLGLAPLSRRCSPAQS